MPPRAAFRAAIAFGVAALLPTFAMAQSAQPSDPLRVLSKSFNPTNFAPDGKADGIATLNVTCDALKGSQPQKQVGVSSVRDENEAYDQAKPQLETWKDSVRKYCIR